MLFLFGGVDLSSNSGAEDVGNQMRSHWVDFVNGIPPWLEFCRFAYGPLGERRQIMEEDVAGRRRMGAIEILREAGREVYLPVVAALTVGRISLLN